MSFASSRRFWRISSSPFFAFGVVFAFVFLFGSAFAFAFLFGSAFAFLFALGGGASLESSALDSSAPSLRLKSSVADAPCCWGGAVAG